MYKPLSLRRHLSESIPDLKQNPDKLLVFADEGRIVASGTNSLSFECCYQLTIIITDYAGDTDTLMVSLLTWVGAHQHDLLTNPERRHSGISFEVDFINHETADYSIKLELSERVIVKQTEQGTLNISHPAEPQVVSDYSNPFWKLYSDHSLLAEWTIPDSSI